MTNRITPKREFFRKSQSQVDLYEDGIYVHTFNSEKAESLLFGSLLVSLVLNEVFVKNSKNLSEEAVIYTILERT